MDGFNGPGCANEWLPKQGDTVEELTNWLADSLSGSTRAELVLLMRSGGQNHEIESGFWKRTGCDEPMWEEDFLRVRTAELMEILKEKGDRTDELAQEWLAGMTTKASCGHLTAQPVFCHGHFQGIAVAAKAQGAGAWTKEELRTFQGLLSNVAVAFENRMLRENLAVQNLVYNTMMDHMQAYLYVTDIHTDRILFMNKSMKEAFCLEHPEGEVCWKVLQRGMTTRCPNCPLPELLKLQQEGTYYQWEEHNTITDCYYKNYDSLIQWTDGSLVHFQHSVDITESRQLSKEARTDELTGLLNRRAGRAALAKLIEDARRNCYAVTVCMYDVNSLKSVNDTYGHREGDNLLRVIANTVKSVLGPDDIACRLSGDEFLAVFVGQTESQAREAIRRAEKQLAATRNQDRFPYELGFCYGMVEVLPEHTMSAVEVMREADERMYEQKRRYHLGLGHKDEVVKEIGWRLLKPEAFDYDQQYLYDALVESTDDYLYVCDMATNTFRYSRKMVEEFRFPGEVIQNAADIWRAVIHPADWDDFWEANRVVTDGESDSHEVEFRARNHDGEWIRLCCRGHVVKNAAGEPRVFAGFIANLGRWMPD